MATKSPLAVENMFRAMIAAAISGTAVRVNPSLGATSILFKEESFVSQHTGSRQKILTLALTAFNQYGTALTMDQLAVGLSVPPGSLHYYFNSKPELIRQLVSFILAGVRQWPPELPHRSLADELSFLLATYRKSFNAFSQTALFDLKLHYPEEWGRIIDFREGQWQRIAAAIEAGVVSGRLRPVDINLVQLVVDGMLLNPFLQDHLFLTELVDVFLLGIAQRAP